MRNFAVHNTGPDLSIPDLISCAMLHFGGADSNSIFSPGTMTTQALINSDLQRGLGRRLRHTTLNTECSKHSHSRICSYNEEYALTIDIQFPPRFKKYCLIYY